MRMLSFLLAAMLLFPEIAALAQMQEREKFVFEHLIPKEWEELEEEYREVGEKLLEEVEREMEEAEELEEWVEEEVKELQEKMEEVYEEAIEAEVSILEEIPVGAPERERLFALFSKEVGEHWRIISTIERCNFTKEVIIPMIEEIFDQIAARACVKLEEKAMKCEEKWNETCERFREKIERACSRERMEERINATRKMCEKIAAIRQKFSEKMPGRKFPANLSIPAGICAALDELKEEFVKGCSLARRKASPHLCAQEFIEERCAQLGRAAELCREAVGRKEEIVERVATLLEKRCEFANYTPQFLPPPAAGERVPVVIATQPNITAPQRAQLETLATALKGPFEIAQLWLWRGVAKVEDVEAIEGLEFVLDVRIDMVRRIRIMPIIAPIVPRRFGFNLSELMPKFQAIKGALVEEQQALLTMEQVRLENYTAEITRFEEEVEGRGIGYAILKFFGLAARRETEDAAFLEKRAGELNESAERIKAIAESCEDVVAKAALLEEVEKLKKKAIELEEEAVEKRKGAHGIFSFILRIFGR